MQRAWLSAALAASTALVATAAAAQSYPAKPVRILVGFAPGGGTDIMARAIGAKLAEFHKQQFVIDNRPGANGNLAARLASEAPADGYTILFMSASAVMSKPVYRNLGYDIEKDLTPISVVSSVAHVLCVHPSLPVKRVKDMIALAKSRPGEVTYGTSGIASPEHFAGELFNLMAGTKLLMIPYKGGGPLAVDLAAGHVMAAFNTMPAVIPHVRSGRVRPVAVSTEKRAPVLPDVPTIAESGVPGYSITNWYGAVAPARTPPEIIARLSQDMVKALQLADVRERFATLGADPVGTTPEETVKFFRSEVIKFTKVAQAAAIRGD